jgi:quinol monooxygenase YgiN
MIVIAGWVEFAPGRRDEAVKGGLEFQAATRRDEPGCVAYVFVADPIDANRVNVYECWADADSLQAHFAHENYFGMLAHLGQCEITGMDIAKHEIARSAPVYTPEMKPSATWWG